MLFLERCPDFQSMPLTDDPLLEGNVFLHWLSPPKIHTSNLFLVADTEATEVFFPPYLLGALGMWSGEMHFCLLVRATLGILPYSDNMWQKQADLFNYIPWGTGTKFPRNSLTMQCSCGSNKSVAQQFCNAMPKSKLCFLQEYPPDLLKALIPTIPCLQGCDGDGEES